MGTDGQGEAIYTMTVAPAQCGCAACRGATRAAETAIAVPVAPATPVATATLPPVSPPAPTPPPAAGNLTPVVAAVVRQPVSVAATFVTAAESRAQPVPERDAPGFTPLAEADLGTAAAPDATSADVNRFRPATAALIGPRPYASLDVELTLTE